MLPALKMHGAVCVAILDPGCQILDKQKKKSSLKNPASRGQHPESFCSMHIVEYKNKYLVVLRTSGIFKK